MAHPDAYNLDGTALALLSVLGDRPDGARVGYADLVAELGVCGVPHRLSAFHTLTLRGLVASSLGTRPYTTCYKLTPRGRVVADSL